MPSSELVAVVNRLIAESETSSEATIQADVRALLLAPEFELTEVNLEVPVGAADRIDVAAGSTVIEVKRTIRTPSALDKARVQLSGYVKMRAAQTGARYVGILTDGRRWVAFNEAGGELVEASRHESTPGASGAMGLLRWLEGVLATKSGVPATPDEIANRLGASSSAHDLDIATLRGLYEAGRDSQTVRLKRELWAKLLGAALGTQFTDDDDLFLEHTLLVNSAEIIAHLLVGFDVQNIAPETLLSGDLFETRGLHGVVDRDFFDWVLEVPGGSAYVVSLAHGLSQFEWGKVEHDVLKVLYESVIPAATRKALGEYYTPDWLAAKIVDEVVVDPLNQRVLDPACGSGTFLFYAVRRYLAAAAAAGQTQAETIRTLSSRVLGIDLHPVAVALARVTYLLAIGREHLVDPSHEDLTVPVYLGDSLGWDQEADLLSAGHLVIRTTDDDSLAFTTDLRFPEHLLADAGRFDALVQALVNESGRAARSPARRKASALSAGTLRLLDVPASDEPALAEVFLRLRQLHEADRDHIWSYYIRNASRPAWLALQENRVDVLVGNPPWLSYRHMSATMQDTFRTMSRDRGFWGRESDSTHQDLAALFIARAVERYLRLGGAFGFVVPNPVIDREYWGGFRTGKFDASTCVAFTPPWDLRRLRPHSRMFPRGSAVVFGTRQVGPHAMPAELTVFRGTVPLPHTLAGTGLDTITTEPGVAVIGGAVGAVSTYADRFANGANLFPLVLFRVEADAASPLGAGGGRTAVRSRRSVYENAPWKDLATVTGTVEQQFVWPVIYGENILPFRLTTPASCVVPITRDGTLLRPSEEAIDRWPGLAAWTREVEEVWLSHRGASTISWPRQMDHMRKLTGQVPAVGNRVVYAASGQHVSAAVLTDPHALVEHSAYWAAVSSHNEASYLVGIMGTPGLTDLVRPYMAYGKDERHVDKSIWRLPIPAYDPDDVDHVRIVDLSNRLASEIADIEFTSSYFVTRRKQVRAHILASPTGQELDAVVAEAIHE